jgi:hypothetical protein
MYVVASVYQLINKIFDKRGGWGNAGSPRPGMEGEFAEETKRPSAPVQEEKEKFGGRLL